ncbi:MAG: glycosyltransferase [Acidimicrobiia bacterium]
MTVVTLYDLIPLIYADNYLRDPQTRSWYHARTELVRNADLVLAISEATARDAIERLEIDPDRVVPVGTGVSHIFRPTMDSAGSLATARKGVLGLDPGYVMYTGGVDFRKNMEGLIAAYARLDYGLRRTHQLVITCRMLPDEERLYRGLAADLGVDRRVLFTNFVTDETLVALYQSASLFVFPSFYEGFGLPAAEALACGTPAVVSNCSSLPEIVKDPRMTFDPTDIDDIAGTIQRSLEDDGLQEAARIRSEEVLRDMTWDAVAERALSAYEQRWASWAPSNSTRSTYASRPRLALFTPWPPQPSGIADYSSRLVAALADSADVDVFVEGFKGVVQPTDPRIAVHEARAFEGLDALRGYDEVVYCMGNSEFHGFVYDALQRWPGVVLAHEVRFTGFYFWYSEEHELGKSWYRQTLLSQHRGLPAQTIDGGWLDPEAAESLGIWAVSELMAASTKFLVHSEWAANVARLAAPEQADKVGVVSFGYPPPLDKRRPEPGRVANFGMVSPVKQTDLFLQAAKLVLEKAPGATFAVVGEASPTYLDGLRTLAWSLGIADKVEFHPRLDMVAYSDELGRANCAVQLRASSNGETSAAVGDCLRHGVPTIVTAIGSGREYGDDVVLVVDRHGSAAELAHAIVRVLSEPSLADRMSAAALDFVAKRGFQRAAKELLDMVLAMDQFRITGAR